MFLQEDKSMPALTEGAVVYTIKTLSLTWLQLPLAVEVKIKLTEPAVNSEALGV